MHTHIRTCLRCSSNAYTHTYLLEVFRKGVEVRNGSNAATILGKLVQSPLELVQGSKTKQIDFTADK